MKPCMHCSSDHGSRCSSPSHVADCNCYSLLLCAAVLQSPHAHTAAAAQLLPGPLHASERAIHKCKRKPNPAVSQPASPNITRCCCTHRLQQPAVTPRMAHARESARPPYSWPTIRTHCCPNSLHTWAVLQRLPQPPLQCPNQAAAAAAAEGGKAQPAAPAAAAQPRLGKALVSSTLMAAPGPEGPRPAPLPPKPARSGLSPPRAPKPRPRPPRPPLSPLPLRSPKPAFSLATCAQHAQCSHKTSSSTSQQRNWQQMLQDELLQLVQHLLLHAAAAALISCE
jgi:hypothetical protein